MTYSDNICGTCGCTIGGGCPESTPLEIYYYMIENREDYSAEEIEAARIAAGEDE